MLLKPRDQVIRKVSLDNGQEVEDSGWVVGLRMDDWHINQFGWEYQVAWECLPSEDAIMPKPIPTPWIETEFEERLEFKTLSFVNVQENKVLIEW